VAADAPPAAPAPAPVSAAAASRARVAAARPSVRLVAFSGVFALAVAVAGYAWMGKPGLWDQRAGTPGAPTAAGHGAGGGQEITMEQIGAMADKLAERLKGEPDNAEGWMMLARSYSVLGRHADAVPVYEKAVQLSPQDAGLLADYADALAVKNNRQIAGEPMKLIERALKLDPNQPKALSLAGTDAFLRGDFAGAAKTWERILQTQPADSPLVQQVRESIAEARQRASLPPLADAAPAAVPAMPVATPAVADPSPAPAAAAGKARVAGTVTLSPKLAAQTAPDDTVFVFARAAEGPRMPLAILRKQVKDLPITFTLDDSMAMAPQMKLSGFPLVVVGARVSKSGNAMPQPGDLQGQTAPIQVGSEGLKIEIGEVVGR
jgi:cytochrome c-type biogenesis protein CcmH